MRDYDAIKESYTEIARKLAENKRFIESLPQDKVKLLNDLHSHLHSCIQTLCECNDLWLSDVRELEMHSNKLEYMLKTEPCEHQLESFAEYDVSWPPKQRGRPKKAA